MPRSTTPSAPPAWSNGASRCSLPWPCCCRAASSSWLLPDAFFLSCRESDKSIRPLTVRAAVNYLCGTLDVPAGQLAAVVASFGEEVVEEYRVGFTMRGEKDVIYGIVWPVYGREAGEVDAEEKGNPLEQICEELRNAGVEEIFRHAALFDPEYCEDCGTPLYADRSGEIVHAELPEDAPTQQLAVPLSRPDERKKPAQAGFFYRYEGTDVAALKSASKHRYDVATAREVAQPAQACTFAGTMHGIRSHIPHDPRSLSMKASHRSAKIRHAFRWAPCSPLRCPPGCPWAPRTPRTCASAWLPMSRRWTRTGTTRAPTTPSRCISSNRWCSWTRTRATSLGWRCPGSR